MSHSRPTKFAHVVYRTRRFEHSFLEVRRGAGRVRHIDAAIGTRVVDSFRELLYRARR